MSYDINLDVIGYIDPDVTVSIIKDGETVEKKKVDLPRELVNIKKCRNPRCITAIEPGIPHIFKLTDEKNRVYRCIYCEADK
jgi:aspartate carbamoyltransferase regulatory subunit